MTSDGTYTYTYDAEGNRTARFVDEDESGTLNTGDTDITEYTWDYRNRLTNVTQRATYGGSATKVTDFAYDYLNRLVSETADPDGAGEEGAQETHFAYDDGSGGAGGNSPLPLGEGQGVRASQIALKFNGSSASDLANRYLWGAAVDQILSDEQVTSLDTPGTVIWPLADNLGTLRDLATYNSQTDTTAVANHRTYNAYGKLTSETYPALDHLFGYTGRQFDDSTALQNNLHRWYDPAVGRWLSQDPIGFAAGDGNLFRYVRNSATNLTDGNGLSPPPRQPVGDDAEYERTQKELQYWRNAEEELWASGVLTWDEHRTLANYLFRIGVANGRCHDLRGEVYSLGLDYQAAKVEETTWREKAARAFSQAAMWKARREWPYADQAYDRGVECQRKADAARSRGQEALRTIAAKTNEIKEIRRRIDLTWHEFFYYLGLFD